MDAQMFWDKYGNEEIEIMEVTGLVALIDSSGWALMIPDKPTHYGIWEEDYRSDMIQGSLPQIGDNYFWINPNELSLPVKLINVDFIRI